MVGKSCRVPGAARLFKGIEDDMRLMAAPVLAATPNGLAARLAGLLKALPTTTGDIPVIRGHIRNDADRASRRSSASASPPPTSPPWIRPDARPLGVTVGLNVPSQALRDRGLGPAGRGPTGG